MAEYRCSSCMSEYELRGGVRYCAKCQEYLFTPCLEYELPKRCQQKVQRTSAMRSSVWSCSGNLPSIEPANIWYMQEGLAYKQCKTHSRTACTVCTDTASKVIKELFETNPLKIENENLNDGEMKTMEEDIQARQLKVGKQILDDEQARQQKHWNKLKKQKEEFLQKIQNFRKEINQILDHMEKVSIEQLECLFQEKVTPHQTEQNNKYSSMLSRVVFSKNTELLENLKSFYSLGEFRLQEQYKQYKIHGEKTVNVAHTDDKEFCSIHSACFTTSGDVLLADFKNKNVKVLDCENCVIKDALSLEQYPLSVCNVNDTEAALCLAETLYLGGNNMIQFLTTKDKLVLTRTIKLDHCCAGICVVGNEIYVSDQRKRIYIYTLQGKAQRTIHKDQTGSEIFSKSYSMAKSDNSKMIHVTDLNKGLITLDKEGHVVWKFVDPDLKMPWGVYTDGKGSCFVAGGNSGNVVQIGPGGNCLGEIVSASHGIKDPQAVCFDPKTSRLIVTRYNCNSVHIFTLY